MSFIKISIKFFIILSLVCLSVSATEKEKDEDGVLDDLQRAGKNIEKETKRVIKKGKNAVKAFDEEPAADEDEKKEDHSDKET